MSGINGKIGAPLTFHYLALPPGFNGRGGVTKTYMTIRGIQFTEGPKVAFPIDPKVKQDLIDSGKSLAGTLPVLSVGDMHLAGHLSIIRYLEAKGGISGKSAEDDFVQDELSDEYATWRNKWATTLGGDVDNVAKYKEARKGYYDLMELFYAKRKDKSSPYIVPGSLPRYADVAVYVMMSDDQATNEKWEYSKHPCLQALWTAIRALPNAKDFVV